MGFAPLYPSYTSSCLIYENAWMPVIARPKIRA
jgi:hypothetical protein